MEYVYLAVFHYNRDDGSYTITYPDLPGCISVGKTLCHVMFMAQDALVQWMEYRKEEKISLVPPSKYEDVKCGDGELLTL